MLLAHVVVVALSAAILYVALRRAEVARLLLVALFAGAGAFNMRLGLTSPAEYLGFAPLTPIDFYRDFILGFFARHAAPIVAAIAAGQIVVAFLLAAPAPASRLGAMGAVAFLVAIAPLGIGSAFPSTLLLAGAAFVVGRRCGARSLLAEITSQWRQLQRLRRRGA